MTLLPCAGRPRSRLQRYLLLLFPCALLIFVLLSVFLPRDEPDYEWIAYLSSKIDVKSTEIINGYLVWNPKCRLQSKNPLDPSVTRLIRKETYKNCSSDSVITKITRESDGEIYLVTVPEQVKHHDKPITCCYAPVRRPTGPFKDDDEEYDSTVLVDECKYFKDKVLLNESIDLVLVRCFSSKFKKPTFLNISEQSSLPTSLIYSNVHAIVNPKKVQDIVLGANDDSQARKLSILVIGIDAVSRLNFQRSMPLTKQYLDSQGWFEFRGHNKVGDNTYPNLMAFLSGLNETMITSAGICEPEKTYGLDKCPFIWYAFKNAGYVTGFGEDAEELSTFTYLEKRGFADPPADYYLRPYTVATEKFLTTSKAFGMDYSYYCTGPELSFFRIVNYAQEFAQTFLGRPYFGFFWTNTISHDNPNAPSAIDSRFLAKLQDMEAAGIMNDSLVILMSDHGARFGRMRATATGWYEDRLPTLYMSLPPWFRARNPEVHRALKANRNRLTSHYDIYETFRDVLVKAGGSAPRSPGCPSCASLFELVPNVRGCSDAGISEHWCACSEFQDISTDDKIVREGAHKFLDFVDDLVKNYTENGVRLCEKFRLKKIHSANQMEINKNNTKGLGIFYLLEVEPGGAKFETTLYYDGHGNYDIREHAVTRVNSYHNGSLCLKQGKKMFCECVK